jgi:FdhD protein
MGAVVAVGTGEVGFAGFCLTEGIVMSGDDIESVNPCAEAEHGNVVVVKLTEEAMTARAEAIACGKREMFLSSSCGLCGRISLDRVEQRIGKIRGEFTVKREALEAWPGLMRAGQDAFAQTGGLHAAALFTPAGEMRVLREDVGRHNAVDKVIGHQLLSGQTPIDPTSKTGRAGVLLVSSRASFEVMQKAAVAGIGMVAAVGAPSSLAVDFATRFEMTLVGFLRPGRMNVYADRGRIV